MKAKVKEVKIKQVKVKKFKVKIVKVKKFKVKKSQSKKSQYKKSKKQSGAPPSLDGLVIMVNVHIKLNVVLRKELIAQKVEVYMR